MRHLPRVIGHLARVATAIAFAGVFATACSDLGDPAGDGADCDRSTGGIDFGAVIVGAFAERGFVIANSGIADLRGEAVLDDPVFSIVSGAGAFVVPPGGEHRIVVRCAPGSTGVHRATLDLGDGCPPVALAGEGVPLTGGVLCVVDPLAIDFGEVALGGGAERALEIRNAGVDGFAVDVAIDGEGAFTIVDGAGPAFLDPGDTLRVTVRFEPARAGGHAARVVSATPCGDVALAGSGAGDVTLSFAADIQPIFTANCVRCHNDRTTNGGLDLRAGVSHGNLVNRVSNGYAPSLRVVPGDPDNSVLHGKVANTGQFGQQMPPTGSLAPELIQSIRAWILEGAVNN